DRSRRSPARRGPQGRPQQLGEVGAGRRGRLAQLPRPAGGPRGSRPDPVGQGLHPAAAHRRPEGRPGLARPHSGGADPDPRRVRLGRGRRRAVVPRRAPLRRRQDQRLPPRLDAVRRTGPRLVRRQAVERLRRPHDHRRHGEGQRRAHRPAGGRRQGCPARHGALPRQAHPRQGRDLQPRGPAGLRAGAGRRDPQAGRPGGPHQLPAAVLRAGRGVLRGLQRAGPGLQPRARAVVPGHGDPEPGHRHHRQRGDVRPQQRRGAGAAQRAHAQPRGHAHRDRRPRAAGRGLRRRRTVRVLLRRSATEGGQGQRLPRQPPRDQV
ncbi:MAG: FIG00967552: hypothetical protein, partial [uncultured Frankineae bacterium]